MRHIQQKQSDCVLASICQIDESLDYEKLTQSYPDRKDYISGFALRSAREKWLMQNIPQYAKKVPVHLNSLNLNEGKLTIPSEGEGIVVIHWCMQYGHAMSYKDGLVLDPSEENARYQVWESMDHYKQGWAIGEIIPLKGGQEDE